MNKQPQFLKKGDKIAIVCPAKKLYEPIDQAVNLLNSWGFEVVLGKTVTADYHQFAGNDELRTRDLQAFLDDPEISAIFAARGGYGTVRIIDRLDFTSFLKNPKWIVGFSDITVLLSHIYALGGIQSIHGQMPKTFMSATPASLESLLNALTGKPLSYTVPCHPFNKQGVGSGVLVGGNLTLLCMVEGSISAVDYEEKILFIEDVGEEEFSIDRMLRMLDRAGKLAQLRGLIIGAFNEIPSEDTPFGQSVDEVIYEIVSKYNYPVCYQFPSGHIDNNLALVVGREVTLKVEPDQVELTFL